MAVADELGTSELKSLVAVLELELRMTAPADSWVLKGEDLEKRAVRTEERPEPTTTRRRVSRALADLGRDYYGIDLVDIYITAPQLSKVRDVSQETARRHLEKFEERGIIEDTAIRDRPRLYRVNPEFSMPRSKGIESEEEIVETCKEFLALLQGESSGSVLDRIAERLGGHPALQGMDGVPVRHVFNDGTEARGEIENGKIRYGGELLSHNQAARIAKKEAGQHPIVNAWRFWDYFDNEAGEWRELDDLRG